MRNESPLPQGWAQVCLSELVNITYGKNLPTSKLKSSGYPVFGANGVIGYFDRYLYEAEQVLISCRGAASGKINMSPPTTFITNNSLVLLPWLELMQARESKRYLYFALSRADKSKLVTGSAQPQVTINNAINLRVNVAPLSEQSRIVAKLDELFSDLDAATAALERVQANLKRYRASVLKSAVEGKLTAGWRAKNPPKETGAQLLERILKERRVKWEENQLAKFKAQGKEPPKDWQKKYPEPVKPDTTNLPELPEGWVWASLEQLSTKIVDGVHKKPNYVPEGIPFVTVRNLTAGKGIELTKLKYITREDHQQFITRANPEYGDILITKDGTLGVTRAVRTREVFSIFVSVAMIKPVMLKMSDYLELAISSQPVQSQMVPKGSGLQHIHLEDLRQDCIPLCTIDEQMEIMKHASELLSIIDNVESANSDESLRSSALRQTILKHAFEGKLVPQDPNDEPASELLKRIREAQEQQEAAAKGTKQERKAKGVASKKPAAKRSNKPK